MFFENKFLHIVEGIVNLLEISYGADIVCIIDAFQTLFNLPVIEIQIKSVVRIVIEFGI